MTRESKTSERYSVGESVTVFSVGFVANIAERKHIYKKRGTLQFLKVTNYLKYINDVT